MNRATRMLEVLRDGQRHSRRDLFERCGFFLTNNAASELRAQGHDIEQSRERVNGDVVYFYRLRGSLSEGIVAESGSGRVGHARSGNPVPSENEQLVASSFEPDQSASAFPPRDDGKHDHAHGGRSGSTNEGELFPSTTHKAPEWA